MSKIKIGIVGCGKQAPKHIDGLGVIPEVELILADIDISHARELGTKEGLPWVEDGQELFDDPSVHAVDICTPTSTHVQLINRALAAGKHFFCEKPLCETSEEACAILEKTTQAGCIGMVGYIYRFVPVFEEARRLFEDVPVTGNSMVLGRIITASFRLGGRGSHHLWKHLKRSGGGAINEMLVHMVDLALWFFGPVADIQILEKGLLRPARYIDGQDVVVDAEDLILVRLIMGNGIHVICQADLLTPAFSQFVEVQGENGSFMGSIQTEIPSYIFCQREAAGFPAGRNEIHIGQGQLFEAQMATFIHSIRHGMEPTRCTIRDSVLLMETIERIRKKADG